MTPYEALLIRELRSHAEAHRALGKSAERLVLTLERILREVFVARSQHFEPVTTEDLLAAAQRAVEQSSRRSRTQGRKAPKAAAKRRR